MYTSALQPCFFSAGANSIPDQLWRNASPVFSEPPKPMLSNSQILSIYPNYPAGGSPHSAHPPYPVTAMPWGQPQQGLVGNQWAGPAVAPWPAAAPVWGSAGQPVHTQGPPAGATSGGDTPTSPMAVNGFPSPFNMTANAPEPVQPTSPQLLWTRDHCCSA